MTPHSSFIGLRHRRTRLAAAATTAVLLAALAGCAKPPVDPISTASTAAADDYHVTHPITIQDQVATMDIPVSVDSKILPGAEADNIRFFGQEFLVSGTTTIAVVAPSGSPNQVAAAGIAVQAENVLRDMGVDPRMISYRVYRAGSDERVAPVRLAYNHIAATTAPCGPWPDLVTQTNFNRHYEAFGCATQQNLAAMVDNPLDLLYPRGMPPADAARRADVLQKYRTGQRFTSDTSGESGGTVAEGVGQ
ncbi:MAG TPA: CpaD family pilus assembly protein [Bauldia sp.]|nr:CpaD family pilus assembly protein [Bauldia sp.]HVZ15029.1 CpaD family pilus assembly protein [Bauldia sp.]